MIRIDHCHFNATSTSNYKIVRIGAGVFGLMDHCILDLTGTNAVYLYNGRSSLPTDYEGNLEWTIPTNFGSQDYFYIEDNIVNGNVPSGAYSTRITDGFSGAKVVIRFNTVSQATLCEAHATGHSPDDRGTRSQEVYGNSATSSLAKDPNFTAVDFSSGTALAWGNSWNQVYQKYIYHFNVTRKDNTTYTISPVPTGWGYAGTQFNGTGSVWDGGTALGSDTVLGYPCLDQPGRGAGDMILGDHPNKLNQATGTRFWPHQAQEPIYVWNNSGTIVPGWGGSTIGNDSGGRVVADRDYYASASGVQTSPTSPFNGTSGTGWGTLANRPTTCTTGVAYWATDQGNWNTSSSNPYGVQQNGADGVLYKATATNTWTLYYTPYTYPHPLNSGVVVPDTTPPTLSTATINPSGSSINLTFSEAVSFGAGGNGGWTLSLTGGAATLSSSGVGGSGTQTLTYNISRTVAAGETGTISYTQPSNGIEDAAGNDFASIVNTAVTNNSAVDVTAPTPNPMTFLSAPASAGPSSITMTATTASDPSSPVQYFFP